MPVNIVATPNAAIQTAATEAAGTEAAGNEDFANLLQDQLALNAGQASAEAISTALPAVVSNASDDSDTSQTDGVLDPTALLATLALVTPAVSNDANTATSDSQASGGTALTALATTTTAAANKEISAATDDMPQSAGRTSLAAASGDTAAKFAVAASDAEAEAGTEKTTAKLVSKAATEDIAVDSSDVHTNLHANSAQHPVIAEAKLSVATPVRDADWSSDLGQKVVWLASSDTQSAQLTLNPEHLGPIDVSVDIDSGSGNATVSFASANAEVRDALESAMPRLREMFASAGIELGQTNVGAESFRQQPGKQDAGGASRSTVDNAILASDATSAVRGSVVMPQRGNGLVDLFA